jgi:hypothetical protein
MADEIDRGNETADLFLSLQLRKQLQSDNKATPMGIGMCINPSCGEDIDGDSRWCSAACRDEWEAIQNRKGRV